MHLLKLTINEAKNEAVLDTSSGAIKIPIIENLETALSYLKIINNLKTDSGKPIYDSPKFDRFSVWSFQQQRLFIQTLREYVRFRPLLEKLSQLKGTKISMNSQISKQVEIYIRNLGFEIINKPSVITRFKKLFGLFVKFCLRLFCLSLSLVAIIKFKLTKTQILLYSPDKYQKESDGDFRIATIYNCLRESNKKFLEIVHTNFGREMWKNFLSRRRAIIYQEAFIFLKPHIKSCPSYVLTVFSPWERPMLASILEETYRQAAVSLELTKKIYNILGFLKPKVIISMDDQRSVNELVAAARVRKQKIYGVQHGHFTVYHAGWMNYNIPRELLATFDILYVWNNFWKKHLLDFSNGYREDNVRVGGPLREPQHFFLPPHILRSQKIEELNILIPYESIADKSEIKLVIKKLKSWGIKIYFKIRPDQSLQEQLNEYDLNADEVIVVKKLTKEILESIDGAIGLYTTFLYDIVYYERPVLVLKSNFVFGQGLIEAGVAKELNINFDQTTLLQKIQNFHSSKITAWPPSVSIKDTINSLLNGI